MTDPESMPQHDALSMPELALGQPSPEDQPSRMPMIIGVVVVVAVVALAALLGRGGARSAEGPADPYAQQIGISGLHLLRAENFVGGQVTYLEGTITNNGNRVVVGATAEVTFRANEYEVAQKERVPILIVTARQPYTDTTPLRNAPLKPGQSREFQLTFERVSESWDGTMPQVTLTGISLQ